MPLSCKSGEDTICSINYDTADWEELRALNAAHKQLRMDCCGSPVTLKTSKLGTLFFAHTRKGECTSAGETAEHLFVKACIARAISGAGWEVGTEVRGLALDGSEWVADVMASRGSHRIAFEVQWSPQSVTETAQRQGRYRACGVRGMWFLRRPSEIQVSKDVPALLIEVSLDPPAAWGRIPVRTPEPYFTEKVNLNDSSLWGQKIELDRFVRGCLADKFIWAPGLNQMLPLEIWAAEDTCWKCKGPTKIITRLDFCLDQKVPGAQRISMSLEDFDTPRGVACLTYALKQADLRSLGIGAVCERYSRTRGESYLSNGCVHCDALQGAFFKHEVAFDEVCTLTVDCGMPEDLFNDDVHASPYRWAFDEGFEASEAGRD